MTTYTAPSLVPAHVPAEHALVQNTYSVFTPSIDRAVQTIGDWLDNQIDGGTIYGPSRFGKSHAVNHWLRDLLSERYGGFIPLIVWNHTGISSSHSSSAMHSSILQASKHPLANARRGPLAVRGMLIERCAELAFQGGGRFLVLVIDEAQGMTQREWLWLVELHSQLDQEHVRLCVISIASVQFNDTPLALALTGSAHASARFMLMQERFYGVRGIEELEYVLAGYDESLFWPKSSDTSYTANLAPEAWREGFRLAQCSERLLAALRGALPEKYAASVEFPMKTIAHCARYILLRLASGAKPEDVTSEAELSSIIHQSGYRTLMSYVSATAILARKRVNS